VRTQGNMLADGPLGARQQPRFFTGLNDDPKSLGLGRVQVFSVA